jgi:hypothetical protein
MPQSRDGGEDQNQTKNARQRGENKTRVHD